MFAPVAIAGFRGLRSGRSGLLCGTQGWLGVNRQRRERVGGIGVSDFTGQLLRCLLRDGCSTANLGVGIARGLSLCGGMSLGDLPLFAASGSLGYCGCLSPARCFETLGGGGAGGFFGLAESTAHGGVGVFGPMGAGGLGCMTCGGIGGGGGGLSFSLSEKGLLAHLLGGTMSQLRAIFAAGCREVAILCAMKICPGVEDRYVFGGLPCCGLIDPVHLA
jgi:hypothetical protein